MRLARWSLPARRPFHHARVHARRPRGAEGRAPRSRSACPPRTRRRTIGGIVAADPADALVEDRPLVDEIIVVDDRSTDDTAAAARGGRRDGRVDRRAPRPTCAPGHGQGRGALARPGARRPATSSSSATPTSPTSTPASSSACVGPLLVDPTVLVRQGLLRAARHPRPGTGGRTTELVARPLHLAALPVAHRHRPAAVGRVRRPAGRCSSSVPFVQGYGVDLGLLVDVQERCGAAAIAQVDLGRPATTATAASTSSRRRRCRSCRPRSPGPGCRPSRPATLRRPGLPPARLRPRRATAAGRAPRRRRAAAASA